MEVEITPELVSKLRELRLHHWVQFKRETDSRYLRSSSGVDDRINSEVDHLIMVQNLNVFFTTERGDTAERDLDRLRIKIARSKQNG
jgi:hypothetical protein